MEVLKNLGRKDADIKLKLLNFPLHASLFGKDVESQLEGWLQHQPPRSLGVPPPNQFGSRAWARKGRMKRKRNSFSPSDPEEVLV